MSGKPPTIREVASRAGVSVATASNVINGKVSVSDASRRAVLAAVAALGYSPNRAARSLRGAASRLVGMVVPDITNVFFAGLVRGVEEQAERSGYDLLLVSSNENIATERRRIEALISRRIDGLLVVPVRDDSLRPPREGAHAGHLPPTVLIDRGDEAPGLDVVAADCCSGAYAATRHLIDLGHRDIVVLAHSIGLNNIQARIAGYRRALEEADLAKRARICVGGHVLDALRGSVEQELRRADPPTAIFALTNGSALAAIKAARGLGLEIPGEVSIVGFDDFDWMSALRPYLTTVAQPIEEFATCSWRLLMERINGEVGPEGRRIELPCTLRVRESSGIARVQPRAVADAAN
jgi:LacI family transcriptional regulator